MEHEFDQLTAERICRIVQGPEHYLRNYPALLQLARCTGLDAQTRQTVLALAAYGWMPTIPRNFTLDLYIDEVSQINSHEMALNFVTELDEPLVNNSWVGTSKILHFICPKHFPIWDSRIAAILNRENQANQRATYLEYVNFMQEKDVEFPNFGAPLATEIERIFKYQPTNMRCLELYLFTA